MDAHAGRIGPQAAEDYRTRIPNCQPAQQGRWKVYILAIGLRARGNNRYKKTIAAIFVSAPPPHTETLKAHKAKTPHTTTQTLKC